MSEEDGGKWKTLPYQREIMDAMTDPAVERVTVKKSARVGYTKMIEALLLEGMHRDPCSQIVVQPTVEDAEGFSKNHMQPAIDRHEFLRGIVAEAKSKTTANTILAKTYFGRTTYFVGANSGRGFRRIHARRAIGDEVDAWDATAGADGDQVELMYRRTAEAKIGRKLILGSTPLIKGASRIEEHYDTSDQRLYNVPCPHCDEGQPFEWGGPDCDFGIKWPDGKPEEAFYLCRHCHAVIEERSKLTILERGAWIPRRESPGHRGYFLWAAYSLSPNATWGHLASEFVRVKNNPIALRTWVNTWRGESWEDRGRTPKPDALSARVRIPLREDGSDPMVPAGAVVGTSFTDVQLDRLECGIEWWGAGEENWKTEYHVLYGDPTAEPVWQALWELLSRPRALERGGVDYIRSSCIDSGYASQSVYAFVRPRPVVQMPDGRLSYFWATKGVTGTGNVWPSRSSTNTIGQCPIYPVRVDTAKDHVSAKLEIKQTGPGYSHFSAAFDEDYFRKLASEHAVDSRDKRGRPVRTWKVKAGHHRNEPWDCAVGNYAALCALYSMGFDLAAEVQAAGIRPPFVPAALLAAEQSAPAHQAQAPGSPVRRQESSWMGGRTRGWLAR